MRYLLPLLLLAACAGPVHYLADHETPPADKGTIIGVMEFDGFGLHRELALLTEKGTSLVLKPKTNLFVAAIPPGEYRIDYIHMYRWDEEQVRTFKVAAGEVVYIGNWKAVLGPGIDLRDELDTLRPLLSPRYGKLKIRTELPGGPGVFYIEVDPLLDPLDGYGD